MECINVNPKDEERLLDWFYYEYAYYKEEQENWRKKEIKENVDELQHLIRDFRSKIDFKKLLDFVGRSRMLAPYNAMLVEMQKPGSTFVFNGRK